MSKLAPGSAVRVLRGGTDHILQVTSPADGTNLGIRSLDAGAFVAADECGNEVPFIVPAPNELVVLPVDGAAKDAGVSVSGPGGRVVDVVPPADPSVEDQQVEPVQTPVPVLDRDAVENVDVRPGDAPAEEPVAEEAPAAKPAKKRGIGKRKK